MSTLNASWPVVLCTWFGAGLLRPAPGTWGSLAAALIAVVILLVAGAETGRWLLIAGLLAATIVGIGMAPAASARFGVEDPPQIVIDEVAGTWIALAVLPAHLLAQPWVAAAAAFLLFRVFDIAKPWPVTWCEHLPRGWGIMADDLVAGLLAGSLATALLG